MSFDEIISKCIDIFSNASSSDPCCLKRYENVVSLLNEMKSAIMSGTYPRDYSVIPLFHYVERNMDSDEMYNSIKALDKWYADNYRNKSEAVLRREQIRNYLLSDGGLSERRADMAISKLARHKDIYLEFSEYVAKKAFPEEGISVAGYTAEVLNQNYPLSPLGAYNYLIYLREMPEEALADLKAGLPIKDSSQIEVITNYEEQFQILRKTGMFYYDVKKDFQGKVDKSTFFSIPGLITNTFGYYRNNDETWIVFVTDDERGVEIKRKKLPTEEAAIEYLIELCDSQNFAHYSNIVKVETAT